MGLGRTGNLRFEARFSPLALAPGLCAGCSRPERGSGGMKAELPRLSSFAGRRTGKFSLARGIPAPLPPALLQPRASLPEAAVGASRGELWTFVVEARTKGDSSSSAWELSAASMPVAPRRRFSPAVPSASRRLQPFWHPAPPAKSLEVGERTLGSPAAAFARWEQGKRSSSRFAGSGSRWRSGTGACRVRVPPLPALRAGAVALPPLRRRMEPCQSSLQHEQTKSLAWCKTEPTRPPPSARPACA